MWSSRRVIRAPCWSPDPPPAMTIQYLWHNTVHMYVLYCMYCMYCIVSQYMIQYMWCNFLVDLPPALSCIVYFKLLRIVTHQQQCAHLVRVRLTMEFGDVLDGWKPIFSLGMRLYSLWSQNLIFINFINSLVIEVGNSDALWTSGFIILKRYSWVSLFHTLGNLNL